MVDWRYNAWGGKYPPCDLDDEVPQHVAKLFNLRLFSPPMILEGGSIEANGAGTLLTTEACLLNPNRNPELTQSQIETYLRDYLGVEQILWLGEGIVGDDTDGHIDDLTRFVDTTTLVTIVEDDPRTKITRCLRKISAACARCASPTGSRGTSWNCPRRVISSATGSVFRPATPTFTSRTKFVVMPGFDHPNDVRARDILQELFPKRRVVVWPALDLIWGLGAFHCITQQQPLAP